MGQKSYREISEKGTLYLIPTPIGNMEDISVRALSTLKMVDLLFCEDTRVTEQLLRHFQIQKKLISCHDHNENQVEEYALELLRNGKNVGLVTDRGTPIISDPGYKISSFVIHNGYSVVGLPGPTALIPALIMSGINPSPFLFYGFLNAKSSKKEKELKSLERLPYTIIFYEAPHRIMDTLKSILSIFGDRPIALCREISKIYEEVYRGSITEVINEIKDGVKGEIVLVVEGNLSMEDYSSLSLVEHVSLYVHDGMSSNEAIKKVAKERGLSKAIVYKEYHIGK